MLGKQLHRGYQAVLGMADPFSVHIQMVGVDAFIGKAKGQKKADGSLILWHYPCHNAVNLQFGKYDIDSFFNGFKGIAVMMECAGEFVANLAAIVWI